MESKNPFNTGSPARGEGFFGRQNIIGNIISFLKKKHQYNLLIFGQRRVGKTSLLRKLQDDRDVCEIAFPVYFNLQDKAETEVHRLLFEIAGRIIMDLNLKIDLNPDDFKDARASLYFQNDFLPLVIGRLPAKKQLLLLFDEFDVLGDIDEIEDNSAIDQLASKQFIRVTANVIEEIQSNGYPVKFIFAAGRNYKDLEPKRYGQIMKFGTQENLSYFTKEETRELLNISNEWIPFDDGAVDEIFSLTSGHPYFAQCLASSSFDAAEKDKVPRVTREIVRWELIPAIKSYSSGIYWVWDSLPANDRIVLFLMASLKEENRRITLETIREKAATSNVTPVVEKLRETMEKLARFKLIKDCNQAEYDFYVEFIRQWVVREVSEAEIEKLLEQIDEEIEFHLTNARYFFKKKNYDQAVQHYEEILKKSPYHFEALFFMAKCYKNRIDENSKYLDNAIGLYKKSYELNRHSARKEYLGTLSEKLKYLKSGKGIDSGLVEREQEIEKIQEEIHRINPSDSKFTTDVEIIKQLELEIGETLEQVDFSKIYVLFQNGFAVNEDGHVIGLNLGNIKFAPRFPVVILKLKYLQVFILSNSGLTDISDLQGLSNLTMLDLSDNQLTDISVLQGLRNLTTLYLSNNQLTDISVLQGLKNLSLLDLRNNKLKKLPEAIVDLGMKIDVDDKLGIKSEILLHGNPLETPPLKIIRKGKEAIKAYFKSLDGK